MPAVGQRTLEFPKGSVACAPEDYLVCRGVGSRWQVYRVEDVLAAKRLVPDPSAPAILLFEEDLLDSMAPAYLGDVLLLLTALGPDFADEAVAKDAIRRQALTERVRGLLRPAREFSTAECRVVRPAAEK